MFGMWKRKKLRPRGPRPHRPRLESLERRDLLTMVTNLLDSGAGSLRSAIASGGSIDFQAGLNGTVMLNSPLSISGNVTIAGGSSTVFLDGGDSQEIFDISSGGDATLSNLIFTHGSAAEGGAVFNGNGGTLSVTNCTFTDNQATNSNWGGGAIANFGALTVDGCSFSSNQATKGGALWSSASATSADVDNCSFDNNTASHGAAIEDESFQTTLQATNDTFHANTASGADSGIIEVGGGTTLTLTNCTVAGNATGTGTSGAIDTIGGTAQYINTIVADDSGDQFAASGGGTLVSLGHNISSDATGNLSATGDLPNTEPLLGSFQTNGGATATMAPTAGSPAINAGDNGAAGLPANDERGLPRILNGTIDIGAVESVEVDTSADNNDANYGQGQLSLREAIGLAPAGTGVLFASGLAGGTIDLSAGGGGQGTALDIDHDLTIDARPLAGGLTISGGGAVEVLAVDSDVTANLAGLTIADGNALSGGGISNSGTLSLTDCTLSNNQSTDSGGGGGAIMNLGTLSVDGATFSGNTAEAIAGSGGALWSTGSSVATVSNSTFTGNSAAYGGAVEYDDVTPGEFINDTFDGNTDSGDDTGIVEADGIASQIDLTNCTVTDNSSGGGGSGAISAYGGSVQYVNTIVAGNTGSQFAVTDTGGTLLSLGNNLSSDGSGNLTAAGDLSNTDPLLGTLANYGGPTETRPLLPGSLAIDGGDSGAAPAEDERGIARVGAADIGAFESRGFTISISGGNNQTVPVSAGFAPLTVGITSGFAEPVQNGRVTFTAPGTGASDSFNAGGVATIDAGGGASMTPVANAWAGHYQVAANARGAAAASFNLTNHGAAALEFTQQPTSTLSAATIAPAVVLQILDEDGQPFASTANVALATNGPGEFTGGSTASAAASNGVATFGNLALNSAGQYSLTASATNMASANSQSFNITANHLVFVTQPVSAVGGEFSAVVAAEDAVGRVDTNFQGTVSVSLSFGSPGSFSGTALVAAVNGLATFSSLMPTNIGLGATLTATSGSLTPATSAALRLVVVSHVVPIAVPADIYVPGPNGDANTAEIRGLYQSILGRAADGVGLSYWTSQLASGVSRQVVAQSLWNSTEHRAEEINQYYRTLLGRDADPAGLAGWLAVMSFGGETVVVAGLLNSSEYTQAHAGADGWLNAMYADVLGRLPGSQEVQGWEAQQRAGMSNAQIAQAIVNSSESEQRVIGSYYAAMLNRPADAASELLWLNLLATGQRTLSTAAIDVLSSDEYWQAARSSVS